MRFDGWLVRLVVIALLALPQSATGAKPLIVGDGTPASCTEMALKHALIIAETVGGATIRFNCGPEPVTIALSEPTITDPLAPVLLVLPNNTTIDGGSLLTLDGTFKGTIAVVGCDATVVLKRLNIIQGTNNAGTQGTSGIDNCGTLTIDRVTLSRNGGIRGGGAVRNRSGGTLTVLDSVFSGNGTFGPGAGIYNAGTLTVRHSTFENNGVRLIAGAIYNVGTLNIDHSIFKENFSIGFFTSNDGAAGAIYNAGTLTITHSVFSDNNGNATGGGILMAVGSSGSLSHCMFSGNVATGSFGDVGIGGGITNFGTLTVLHSVFSENSSISGGGIFNGGVLTVDHSTISQNTASSAGGGIYNDQGTLTLTHTSVTENTPDDIFP